MAVEVVEDGATLFIEDGRGTHVEERDEPGDEELGEREEVGDVDGAEDGRGPEVGARSQRGKKARQRGRRKWWRG